MVPIRQKLNGHDIAEILLKLTLNTNQSTTKHTKINANKHWKNVMLSMPSGGDIKIKNTIYLPDICIYLASGCLLIAARIPCKIKQSISVSVVIVFILKEALNTTQPFNMDCQNGTANPSGAPEFTPDF